MKLYALMVWGMIGTIAALLLLVVIVDHYQHQTSHLQMMQRAQQEHDTIQGQLDLCVKYCRDQALVFRPGPDGDCHEADAPKCEQQENDYEL